MKILCWKNKKLQTVSIIFIISLSFFSGLLIYDNLLDNNTENIPKNIDLESYYGDNVNIETTNGFTRITPKASDIHKEHTHYQNISRAYNSDTPFRVDTHFSSGSFAQTGWIPDYTFSSESSGMGLIYMDQIDGKSVVVLRGETQKQEVGGYGVPELPEDMSINSGNLWDEEYANFGGGTLRINFIPNNIKTIVEYTWVTIGYVPVPIPTMVYVNTFYIYVRTSAGATFMDPVYTYTVSEYGTNEEQTVEIPMHDYNIVDYFEISLRAFVWDDSNWVAINYCTFDSYNIKVEEEMDNDPRPEYDNGNNWDKWKNQLDPYGIPSNYHQNLTIDFTSVGNIDFNPNSVRVYVNPSVDLDYSLPDTFYKVVPGQVDINSIYFPAIRGSGYSYTCMIPRETYIAGHVGYRIRFLNNNGVDFWTPTFSFHAYDNEDPWIDEGTVDYDENPEYQNDLVVAAMAHDTGGSHLKRASLYYASHSFTSISINDIESLYSSSRIDYLISPDAGGIYPDDAPVTFTIPSYALNVHNLVYFVIVVEDRAGNKNKTITDFSFDADDNIAPRATIRSASYRLVQDSNLWDGHPRNVSDLGYPLNISWRFYEPPQAAGVDSIIAGLSPEFETEPVAPVDIESFVGEMYYKDGNGESIVDFALNHDLILYNTSRWFQVVIFANDTSGNEHFSYINLYIEDVRPPDIIEGINNSISPNFNEDFVLEFSAWEPENAYGVDNSTIEFRYYIEKPNLNDPISHYSSFNSHSSILPNTSYMYYLDSGSYRHNTTYTIPQGEYNYGDIIYYEFVVEDGGGNKFSTTTNPTGSATPSQAGLRYFVVADRIAPHLEIHPFSRDFNNYTTVYSYFDIGLSATIFDQEDTGGSGIDSIRLYYTDSSGFIDYKYNHTWSFVSNISYYPDNDTYRFVILDENFSIFEDNPEASSIYLVLLVKDKAGNIAQWSQTIGIYDNYKPNVIWYNYGSVDDDLIYIPTLNPLFYFELDRPSYLYFMIDGIQMMEPTSNQTNITQHLVFDRQGPHHLQVFYNDFMWERIIIIDTIPPTAVESVTASRDGPYHVLEWERPPDLDDDETIYYYIYRGTTEDFEANANTFVGIRSETEYRYHFDVSGTFYYRVRAVDAAKNEAELSPVSNRITSVAQRDAGLIIGIILAVIAGVAGGLYALRRYQNFYGIEKGSIALKERLRFRNKQDFSKTTEKDIPIKENLAKENVETKSNQKVTPPADAIRSADFEDSHSNDGWEDEQTGWD